MIKQLFFTILLPTNLLLAMKYDETSYPYNAKAPEDEIHLIKEIVIKLKNGKEYFSFPEKMIENADKNDLIAVEVRDFRMLEREALDEQKRMRHEVCICKYPNYTIEAKKISHTKNKIFFYIWTIAKAYQKATQQQIPLELKKSIIEQAIEDDFIYVSEYDIMRLTPFFAYSYDKEGSKNPYLGGFPLYEIIINDKSEFFTGPETEVIYYYQHFLEMCRNGWISFYDKTNQETPTLWYRPLYVKSNDQIEHLTQLYHAPFGPRFREILYGNEKSAYGDLWSYYDFEKDPHYNFKKLDFLSK